MNLSRVLDPRTIAVVGASEAGGYAANARATLDSDAEVFCVNPRYETVFGRACHPSLSALGRPIDAVFSLISAERTVDLVEEAVGLDVGGVITVAAGFAEAGAAGARLQERMTAAARGAGMPVIGPNGVGYVHVPRNVHLCMLPPFESRPGGVSVVAHSGAVLGAIAAAGRRAGGVGFNRLISTGNEPVTDMADYLDFLAGDEDTRIIGLILENVRRPGAFFAAAAKARRAGKPILVVKLARSERTQRMALSHSATLTGDAWVYEQAFKQAGILRAGEIDELIDRLQFFEQLPRERWSPVRGLALITTTGGFASMAADLATEERVDMPEAPELAQWIGTVLPGATVPNPLDLAGLMRARPAVADQVLDTYFRSPAFDTYLFTSLFGDADPVTRENAETFATRAVAANQPAILAPLAGRGPAWLDELRPHHGVAVGNGLRGCLRGLNAMATFMRGRADAAVVPAEAVPPISAPAAQGPPLGFEATLELLRAAGIPTAPAVFLAPGQSLGSMPFAAPYVVKLADVAHRSDIGAVRTGVRLTELGAAVTALRGLAAERDLPATVCVQPQVTGSSEVFVGIRGASELGPVVAFGLGGIFVEVLERVAGRLAPLTAADAGELIAEFDDTGMLAGRRGQRAWDHDALAEVLVRAGRLAAGARAWLETLDINPLLCGPEGIVAVDALCVLRGSDEEVL